MDSTDLAYRVPFELRRDASARTYLLTNVSAETLDGVALTMHGGGVLGANSPALLRPAEALEVSIAGRNLARNSILVVRWFRPDGVEYLWRVSF
jgi:hypothetical protein